MEWQIKTIARKSALTGDSFEPGQQVTCLIFKDEEADELGRADLLLEEVDQFELPGPVLGRWTRVIKDPEDEAEGAKMVMASAEDFFMSLFEVEQTEPDLKLKTDGLKHILSLMLERKRVLRAIPPRQTEGLQRYTIVKRKEQIEVPIVEISAELMLQMEDTIGDIIL